MKLNTGGRARSKKVFLRRVKAQARKDSKKLAKRFRQ
jgi:hypothetical protein